MYPVDLVGLFLSRFPDITQIRTESSDFINPRPGRLFPQPRESSLRSVCGIRMLLTYDAPG